MNAVVFCGPTISPDEVRSEFHVTCLPPVSQGGVYRAALERPAMIGIIDGCFRQVPSVWHKEILWAMARGIAVFGSASMGALRAAELAPFGMIGVGSVFHDYHSGKIEDDDEVAVVHGTAEQAYRAMSEPMVNIRATLQKAEADGVIGAETCAVLIAAMKQAPYPARSFECLLQEAARHLGPDQLAVLRSWLPTSRIDRKREDARLMLLAMRQRWESSEPPPAVQFHFHHTAAWQNLISSARPASAAQAEETVAPDLLLEELYLYRGRQKAGIAGAFGRHLALEDAGRRGYRLSEECAENEEMKFRSSRGLTGDEAFAAWLRANDLSYTRFREFLAEECLLTATRREHAFSGLPNYLRSVGLYPELAARATSKHELLMACGLENPRVEDTGLDPNALLNWYLDRVPRESASYLDLLDLARQDAGRLLRAAVREYLYAARTEASEKMESDE